MKYTYKNKKQREKAVNRQDKDHMTPLHYAAKYAQYDAAKTLIRMNADPTIKGDDGCLPLHFAVKYRPEAFRPLVKSQSDPENDIPNENDFEGKPETRNKEDDFLKTLEFLIQARVPRTYPVTTGINGLSSTVEPWTRNVETRKAKSRN